jgi:hypothetical protein
MRLVVGQNRHRLAVRVTKTRSGSVAAVLKCDGGPLSLAGAKPFPPLPARFLSCSKRQAGALQLLTAVTSRSFTALARLDNTSTAEHHSRWNVEEVTVLPSRAIRGLILAVLALVAALDGYVAYTAPILSKEPGYARHCSHAKAALTLAASVTSDDDDGDSPRSDTPPNLIASEPLAPVIVAGREAWVTKARPAGEVVQHPPCAVPQTGPPAPATA